ncbi:MAG: hypothetical protein ABSH41_03390 [Syntrophobacteraceae bacterium]
MRGAKIGGELSMSGAKCTGKLNMNPIEVTGALLMRNGAEFSEVDLSNAKIGQLDMTGSKCTGKVLMNQIEITGALFMRYGAWLSEVDLRAAKVGRLDMSGAKFTGKLNMNGLTVTGSLLMYPGAEFSEVDLGGAQIGEELSMSGAKCTGKLNMNGLTVTDSLLMYPGAEFSEVDLVSARIGGGLYILGGRFTSLDLTDTSIKTVLNLGFDDLNKTIWSADSRLLLRNTVVDAMQAPPRLDAFPNDLDLNGFKYNHLGEWRGADKGSEMASRDSKWFTDWLGKDRTYSPQPYYQLAEVLRTMGHPEKAKDILYAGKERELSEAIKRWEVLKWLGLSLLSYTIGYGYHYTYIVPWVIGLILLGACVYKSTSPGKASSYTKPIKWGESLAFSFDMLLPIVRLDQRHYDTSLSNGQRYYFYVHKLVGYVLGLFIIAGLSGITK